MWLTIYLVVNVKSQVASHHSIKVKISRSHQNDFLNYLVGLYQLDQCHTPAPISPSSKVIIVRLGLGGVRIGRQHS